MRLPRNPHSVLGLPTGIPLSPWELSDDDFQLVLHRGEETFARGSDSSGTGNVRGALVSDCSSGQ